MRWFAWGTPVVLVAASVVAFVWLVHRGNDQAPQPILVGRIGDRPTVTWPVRVVCRPEQRAVSVCTRKNPPVFQGEGYDLRMTVNLDPGSADTRDVVKSLVDLAPSEAVICPPAVAAAGARCTTMTGVFDVPSESAVYVR